MSRTGMRGWLALRRQVLDRDGWRCTACGRAGALEVHHRRPVHQGGDDTADNLATLCRGCHQDAHRGRPPPVGRDAWRQHLQRYRGAPTR